MWHGSYVGSLVFVTVDTRDHGNLKYGYSTRHDKAIEKSMDIIKTE